MEGRVNVTVEPAATFTSARGFSYIASILFTQVKLRDSGSQPSVVRIALHRTRRIHIILSNSRIVILVN